MRIIVTGGTGRLGSYVVAELVSAGHEVVAADRSYKPLPGAQTRVVNFLERNALYPLLEGADAVVHLANHSNSNSSDAQTVLAENTAMNVHVFQVCAELGIKRVVFASSIQVITGGPLPSSFDYPAQPLPFSLPLDGDAAPLPANTYAVSKANAEEALRFYARIYGLSTQAIRFPWVCSSLRHLSSTPLHSVASLIKHRRREACAWIWARDAGRLVRAILASDLPGARTYLPSSPLPQEMGDITSIIREHFSDCTLRKPLQEITSLVDNSPITADTGWIPLSYDEIIAQNQSSATSC